MAISDNFFGGESMELKKDYLSLHILFDKLWCLERKNLPIKRLLNMTKKGLKKQTNLFSPQNTHTHRV